MKNTVTHSVALVFSVFALFTAAAAAGAPPAPCTGAPDADAGARLTERLETHAEAARVRSYGDALRGFTSDAGQDAQRRHREIAETVAARTQAATADAMLRLAAAPGSAVRSVSADNAPSAVARVERTSLPARETIVALALKPECR